MTQIDPYVTAKLQQWLRARRDPIGPEIKLLVEQLNEFGSAVHREGFESAVRKKMNIAVEGTATIGLLESIAKLICSDIDASERTIGAKSLQETFFLCTGIDALSSPFQIGQRLETYLRINGSKGLIRQFLGIHLCNVILIDLHDSLQASGIEMFQGQMEAIERLSQKVARLAVRSWGKWPKLTDTTMNSALQTVAEEMRNAVDPKPAGSGQNS